MGVVHRARDTVLGRVVALKVLSADLGADDELHRRFRREAEAIGQLSHPNIVSVYDLGESEGQLYMAMELLEGDDLRKLIDRRADIPMADRVRVLRDIALGLAFAHSRGVVHRDLKPGNVMVGAFGEVQVMDWGLGKRLGDPDAKTPLPEREGSRTRAGQGLGTPAYMSPEQARGEWDKVDERSDVFGLGAILCAILTGEPAYTGTTDEEVLSKANSGDVSEALALVAPYLGEIESTFTLCLITRHDAYHLMGVPAAAGGWIAVDMQVRYTLDAVLSHEALLARLPEGWSEASRAPVDRALAIKIAERLDHSATWLPGREAEIAREWARRVREAIEAGEVLP